VIGWLSVPSLCHNSTLCSSISPLSVGITVPLLRPASVVVIALAVINTLKGFDIVFILTKGGPFHTSDNLAMFMYSETFFKYQFGYGAAVAVALFILAIIVIYFRQVKASERLYG
jgi:ABC-type sugar transport system permease subunit